MTFTQDWFSSRIPVWEEVVKPVFKDKPVRALEIGSFEGRSAIWINDNLLSHPESSLLCVDIWENPVRKTTFLENTKDRPKIDHIQTPALEFLSNNFEHFDFVYIDADHTAKTVLLQSRLIWPFIAEGGVLAFDDYMYYCKGNNSPPKEGIDTFLSIYNKELELLSKGLQVIVRKC